MLLPGARSNHVKRADLFDRVLELVADSVRDVRGVSLEGYSRHDVANVMNAVDVVLLTSDSEGSPVTVKEALASMTPVVSVPVSDQEVRFFEPGNAGSLADALLAVSQDPHAASLRAERARRRYAGYRWDVNRQRYVGILDRLSSGNASAALPVPRP